VPFHSTVLIMRSRFVTAAITALFLSVSGPVQAQEIKFPQIIQVRYEAVDQKAGGQLLIWAEREKIWYGLDPRLPAVRSVEVTHTTPSQGSITLTTIVVTTVSSANPDYFHLSGNVRFKVSGMVIKSTNVP
jgi:hypothetical protein